MQNKAVLDLCGGLRRTRYGGGGATRNRIAALSLGVLLILLGLRSAAGEETFSDKPFAHMQKVELVIARTTDDCIEVERRDGRPLAIVAYGFTQLDDADPWKNLCIAQAYLADQAAGKNGLGAPQVFGKNRPLCALRAYAGFRKVAAGASLLGVPSLDCRSGEPQRGRSYGVLLYQRPDDGARSDLAYGMARFTIAADGSVRQLP